MSSRRSGRVLRSGALAAVAVPTRAPEVVEPTRQPTPPAMPLAVVHGGWGWLPLLSLSSACGLLVMSLGFTGARLEGPWARWGEPLFWLGLLVIFVPVALRLLAVQVSRRERIGLAVVLGMALYLVKIASYPTMFALHDEFLHWRTADDIMRGGELFAANPLLPVSALYPGLETITAGLASVSGMSLFLAGTIILGAARLLFALALYLFFEQVGRSARIAGIATVLYMVNPKFIVFDAQFAYESLALPITALLLFLLVRRSRERGALRLGLTVAALPTLGLLVITHHLTSFAVVGFLLLWSVVALVARLVRPRSVGGPGGIAILGLVLCAAWLIYVATLVVGYLAPSIEGSVTELLRVIAGEDAGRQLFRDSTGQVAPLWERATGFASTLLILFGMPFGLYQLWRRYRMSPVAVALGLAALAYPASLTLRFTQAGGEVSDRAAGVLFFAVAFVLALAIVRPRAVGGRRILQYVALTTLAALLFVGEVIVGSGPSWARLPGPYLVASDARSIEPLGLDAAFWTRAYLGPDNRIATDRINALLLGSYGHQRTVTHAADGIDISPLFFSLGYGTVQEDIVRRGAIGYLVVDRRLSTALPGLGIYFEAPEADANRHLQPIDPAALAKFDRLSDISRIYDSGDIVIYVIGAGTRER